MNIITYAPALTDSQRTTRRLIYLGLVLANLLVILIAVLFLAESREQHEFRATALTRSVAQGVDQAISKSIDRVDLSLRAVVDELERQLTVGGLDEATVNALLERYQQRAPEIEAFRIANADGAVFLDKGVDKARLASWADRD